MRFSSPLLAATAVATVATSLVSAFQPGSDYDVYKTPSLYNCSGETAFSTLTESNAADTLPQIESSAGEGWEQWSLFLHGTLPIILRWNHGNPSSYVPTVDTFDLLIVNLNGTTIQKSVSGDLRYTNDEKFKRIAIGNNLLTWDTAAQWFNVSLNVDGYQMKLNSFVAVPGSFHPNVAFHNGMLDESGEWFGSVPSLRSQVSKDSSLDTPENQTISLQGLVALKHIFSEKPLPAYINKYYASTAWGYSTAFYDSHLFYRTETTNGTVHDVAYLGRALASGGSSGSFSSTWATYDFADNNTMYNLTIDPQTVTFIASLPGCSSTDNIPYIFNVNASTLLGEFNDIAGGRTSYFTVNGSTSAPFEGKVTTGAVQGYFEEYQAPSQGV